MDLREIDELTAKLEQTGDITKEEDVFLGTRRINDIERELASKSEPMEGGKVVLAAKDGLENFISASINPTAIEEALFKIRPDPVFEGSRKALEKTMWSEPDFGPEL